MKQLNEMEMTMVVGGGGGLGGDTDPDKVAALFAELKQQQDDEIARLARKAAL